MIVCVASNFVLEIALTQEESSAAEVILDFAERNESSLAIPSVSVSEPFSTVSYRSVARNAVVEQLRNELHDLRRSRALEEEVRAIELAPVALDRIKNLQLDSLIGAAERILNIATVIPIDAGVSRQAVEYRARYRFSPQDAIVFASIVRPLTDSDDPQRRFFMTRDKKGFQDDPGIAKVLHALNCELLTSFPEAALRLGNPLPG